MTEQSDPRKSDSPSLVPAPDGHPIKLVRDNTAAIINTSGEPGALFYAPSPPDPDNRWLRKKLLEEVAEYVVDGGLPELRDVFVVVLALAEAEGSGLVGLMRMMEEDPRGGFSRRVMMYGHHPEFDR